ncbi:MAG: hypothetical protein JWM05_2147 [Acidimicrobiales bacterium]|nr:hypothetical protein [Acidimicrobiales bacterium]
MTAPMMRPAWTMLRFVYWTGEASISRIAVLPMIQATGPRSWQHTKLAMPSARIVTPCGCSAILGPPAQP